MKVLYIARTFSGLESSFINKKWNPTGVPTIYKIIEALDKNYNSKLIFTAKDNEEKFFPKTKQNITLEGLKSSITILPGEKAFASFWGPGRKYLREIYHLFYIIFFAIKFRPNIIYIGNANIWIGAIFSYFGKWKVVFRVMGIFQAMKDVLVKKDLLSRIIKYSYKASFSCVIATQDGTGVEEWMKRALNFKVPKFTMLNGVQVEEDVKIIHPELMKLPQDKTIVMFLGRLEPEKGCFEFVKQFIAAEKEVSGKLHALIIGTGVSEKKIHEIINQSKSSDKFTLIKKIEHQKIYQAYKCSDIYVSINKRGNLSNVNLEALSTGLCVLLPESRPNLYIDEITEKLFDRNIVARFSWKNDCEDLKTLIIKLSHDKERRLTMGKNTKEIAKKVIPTWDARIKKELDILESLVSK